MFVKGVMLFQDFTFFIFGNDILGIIFRNQFQFNRKDRKREWIIHVISFICRLMLVQEFVEPLPLILSYILCYPHPFPTPPALHTLLCVPQQILSFILKLQILVLLVFFQVTSVAFSADGSYFVTVGNRHVKFWYLDSNKSKVTVLCMP